MWFERTFRILKWASRLFERAFRFFVRASRFYDFLGFIFFAVSDIFEPLYVVLPKLFDLLWGMFELNDLVLLGCIE